MAYVNTICIWAISRSSQIDIVDRNAVAACNVHVEIFAIDRADLVNKSILYFAQLNGLQHGKKSQNHSKFILLRHFCELTLRQLSMLTNGEKFSSE